MKEVEAIAASAADGSDDAAGGSKEGKDGGGNRGWFNSVDSLRECYSGKHEKQRGYELINIKSSYNLCTEIQFLEQLVLDMKIRKFQLSVKLCTI